MTEKQRALETVQHLPEDATVEDAIERLCFSAAHGNCVTRGDTTASTAYASKN